jgi:hypothetical protein
VAAGKSLAAAHGGWIVFEDEAGFSMTPPRAHTWGQSVEQSLYRLRPETPAQLPQCSFRRKTVIDARQARHELVPHAAVSEGRKESQGQDEV